MLLSLLFAVVAPVTLVSGIRMYLPLEEPTVGNVQRIVDTSVLVCLKTPHDTLEALGTCLHLHCGVSCMTRYASHDPRKCIELCSYVIKDVVEETMLKPPPSPPLDPINEPKPPVPAPPPSPVPLPTTQLLQTQAETAGIVVEERAPSTTPAMGPEPVAIPAEQQPKAPLKPNIVRTNEFASSETQPLEEQSVDRRTELKEDILPSFEETNEVSLKQVEAPPKLPEVPPVAKELEAPPPPIPNYEETNAVPVKQLEGQPSEKAGNQAAGWREKEAVAAINMSNAMPPIPTLISEMRRLAEITTSSQRTHSTVTKDSLDENDLRDVQNSFNGDAVHKKEGGIVIEEAQMPDSEQTSSQLVQDDIDARKPIIAPDQSSNFQPSLGFDNRLEKAVQKLQAKKLIKKIFENAELSVENFDSNQPESEPEDPLESFADDSYDIIDDDDDSQGYQLINEISPDGSSDIEVKVMDNLSENLPITTSLPKPAGSASQWQDDNEYENQNLERDANYVNENIQPKKELIANKQAKRYRLFRF